MLLKVTIPGYQAANEESTAYFLILMVLIFTALTVIFLILLFISKLSEMSRKRKKETLTPYIDMALLGILFENQTIANLMQDKTYRKLSRKRFFRNLLVENIMRLHASFAGDYQVKLQEFYEDSGLSDISFRKLRRWRWHIRCEGVNELSRMRVKEALPEIIRLTNARNNVLKQEALLGIIRLQGLQGLLTIADHPGVINDWIQLNILSVVKNAGYAEIPDFGRFLESSNESVVVLGIRLVHTFGQLHHLQRIREILMGSTSRRILVEGQRMDATIVQLTQPGSL